jgi:hypothetical protein
MAAYPVGQQQGPLQRWQRGGDGAELQLDKPLGVEGVGDAGDVTGPFHHRHRFLDVAAGDGRLPQQGGDVGPPSDCHGDGAQIAQGPVHLLSGIEAGKRPRQVACPPQRVPALAERVADAEAVTQRREPGDGVVEQRERQIRAAADALGEGGGHGQVPARLGRAHPPAQQHRVLGDRERHGPAVVDDPRHRQGGEERR